MIKKSVCIIIFILSFFILLFSKDNKNVGSNNSLQKPQAISDIWLDANRLRGVFRNNGIWYFDVIRNTQGTEWPAGSGKSPIFAAGQWIAAKVNGEIKVAAIQHSATEFQPGEIDSPGVALNPKDPVYRWYELRSDGMGDWTNWPLAQGAPVDENGNPLLIGDQTIFSVWNDLTSHAEFGSNPLGVEVRQLAFAFDDNGVLGDMHFIKWQIVNKSDSDWDSTYFAIWMDPDLGSASDDLFGCDSTLDLGFVYNQNNTDYDYGNLPPAMGTSFLQGPLIHEIGSVVKLPSGKVLQDTKMLKMTNFLVHYKGSSIDGSPRNWEDIWNYIRNRWRNGQPTTLGDDGKYPPSIYNPITKYMFTGDPETGSGWLQEWSNDNRFVLSSGPFNLPKWIDDNNNGLPDFGEQGVQEIIAVVIMAQGTNHLNSVTELKRIEELAQLAYDKNFNYKQPPRQPFVQSSELANQIILTWDERSEYNDDGTLYDSEDIFISRVIGDTIYVNNLPVIIDDSTYNFYGYKVYQYSDVSGTDPVLVASWDIGENKDAQPYTKQRYIILTKNKNLVVGELGKKLINGKTYYFGVVAEGFLEFGNPKIFASKPAIVSVVPRITPGITYSSQFGDSLEVTHTVTNTNGPLSDGNAIVWIIDPSKTTGLIYTINFNADSIWNLINSIGDTIAKNQINQTGNDAYNIYDGLMVKVLAGTIPNTINDIFTFTSPTAPLTSTSNLKNDLEKIKVVPNPYYGLHSGELSQIDRWVQFTFLPPKCTIRIFTMSGHLVRKLDKDDATTPFLRWDLLNEYDVPVASGIFIYHVEAPGIGERTGKMVIFMSTYRPDTWRSYNEVQ